MSALFELVIFYSSLVYAPVFLFGFIKLRQQEDSNARKFLVFGFMILTITATYHIAIQLEVFKLNYSQFAVSNQWGYGPTWEPWEKWIFWGVRSLVHFGTAITAVGFFIEGKDLLSKASRSPSIKES